MEELDSKISEKATPSQTSTNSDDNILSQEITELADGTDLLEEYEYVVERIIDHRIGENGEYQYFLKWKGYPDDDCSWENETNIFALEMIQEYWDKNNGMAYDIGCISPLAGPSRFNQHVMSGGENAYSYSDSEDAFISECFRNHSSCQDSDDNNISTNSINDDGECESQVDDYAQNDQLVGILGEGHTSAGVKNANDIKRRRRTNRNKDNFVSRNHIDDDGYLMRFRSTLQNSRSDIEIKKIAAMEEVTWEKYVESVDYVEREENTDCLVVFLTWKNGQKTAHDSSVANLKCPQKIIEFYEQHVQFIPTPLK
ncbi:9144_t:CDS:2 [Acaulospora morrowiae]|uniref:9144_t:CDS:1 n=1 Tax=Acaulospora morrowiae TaxID=94023 RepID=A0A9N9BWS8_9GLOM|nr:9144_t:CDS:2 [Acaulospora morrowiae]